MTPEQALADPASSVGWLVRTNHHYGFRSGQWALISSISTVNNWVCWEVIFPDGEVDTWPISDTTAQYELKPGPKN